MGSQRADRARQSLDFLVQLHGDASNTVVDAAKVELDAALEEVRVAKENSGTSTPATSAQLREAEEGLETLLGVHTAAVSEEDHCREALAEAQVATTVAAENLAKQRDVVETIKANLSGGVPIESMLGWTKAIDALLLVAAQIPRAIEANNADVLVERMAEHARMVRESMPAVLAASVADGARWAAPVVVAGAEAPSTGAVAAADAAVGDEEQDSEELSQPTQPAAGNVVLRRAPALSTGAQQLLRQAAEGANAAAAGVVAQTGGAPTGG
jgi:hypothetical protein